VALSYLMDIWGAKPRVTPLGACPPPDDALWAQDRVVYVSLEAAAAAPDCLSSHHRSAAGTQLVRVSNQPLEMLPPTAEPTALDISPALRLVGYELQTEDRAALTTWRLSLYWQAQAPLENDVTISVRPWRKGRPIMDAEGAPLIQDHQPVWGLYPTSTWQVGELVRDDYVLSLPRSKQPDTVQVLVYRALAGGGFENVGQVELNLGKD
jgi:hypothetical protein